MNIAFNYSWSLPDGDIPQVRAIIEKLRAKVIELGGESLGVVIELNEVEARRVRPGAKQIVMFAAAIPGISQHRFGLAKYSGAKSWSWDGVLVQRELEERAWRVSVLGTRLTVRRSHCTGLGTVVYRLCGR